MTIAERLALCDKIQYEMYWTSLASECTTVGEDVIRRDSTPFGLATSVAADAQWAPWSDTVHDYLCKPFNIIGRRCATTMYQLYDVFGDIDSITVLGSAWARGPYVSDAVSGPATQGGQTRPVGGWATAIEQAQLIDNSQFIRQAEQINLTNIAYPT
jgi:hypothetical protein